MISPLNKLLLVAISLVLATGIGAQAQNEPASTSVQPMSVDARISAALQQVSAERIQANIEKLVSFGTRLTLSAQDPSSIAAGRGIGAAREWIKSEFERYSKDCGGCLEVKTDSFTEPAADRIPRPTEITNVYAVLKGTDAENCKAHRAGDWALRLAPQRHFRYEGRRSRGERRWQRNRRQPGMRAGSEQAEVSGNNYFSDGRGRGAGAERQPPLRRDVQRKDGEGTRLEPGSRVEQ